MIYIQYLIYSKLSTHTESQNTGVSLVKKMSTPSNTSNTNASSSFNTETHKKDGETSLLEERTTQDATQLPNQADAQENNKAETQEKPEGNYT